MRTRVAYVLGVFTLLLSPCYGKDYGIGGAGSYSLPQYKAPEIKLPDSKIPDTKIPDIKIPDYTRPSKHINLPSVPPLKPLPPNAFKPPKFEFPGTQPSKRASEKHLKNYPNLLPGEYEGISEYDETPNITDDSNSEEVLQGTESYKPGEFHNWTTALESPNGGVETCSLSSIAVDRYSIFPSLRHHVRYYVDRSGEHRFQAHVPREPHARGTPVIVIGTKSFPLVAQTRYIYGAPEAMRPKLVKAMKSGQEMIVKWMETDGTRWDDHYPLKGTADAFYNLAKICPYISMNCPMDTPNNCLQSTAAQMMGRR